MDGLAGTLHQIVMGVWQATWRASLLIGIVLAIRALLGRRLSPRGLHVLWLVVVVRLLLPLGPASRLSLYNLLPQGTARSIPISSDMRPVAPSDFGPQVFIRSSSLADQPGAVAVEEPMQRVTDHRSARSWENVASVLAWVWLAGALGLAAHIVAGHYRLWRVVRHQRALTHGTVLEVLEDCRSRMNVGPLLGIVVTDRVQGPALFGCIRPKLLLPVAMWDTLSGQDLRYVFMHELAHLRRRDVAVGWLISFCQVLHWFNPLVWLAFHQMRIDRELACDQLAISYMAGPEDAQSYGRTLVRLLEVFSQNRTLAALAGISENGTRLKTRMEAIARYARPAPRDLVFAVGVLILVCVAGLTDATGRIVTLSDKSIPPDLQSGLYLYYAFDEPGGDKAVDLSPARRHGLIHGCRTVREGFGGGALQCDGRDGYILIDPMPPGAFSVCAWINPMSSDIQVCRTVFLLKARGSQCSFGMDARGRIEVIRSSGGSGTRSSGRDRGPVWPWVHMALTCDGGVLRLYQNGILCLAEAIDQDPTGLKLYIGGGTPGIAWWGLLDEVVVFQTSLDTDQIRQMIQTMGYPTPRAEDETTVGGTTVVENFNTGSQSNPLTTAFGRMRMWRSQMDMTVRTLGIGSGAMDPNRWQTKVERTQRLAEQIADLKMALEDGPQGEVGPVVPVKGRDFFRQQDRQQLRYALDALIGVRGDRVRVRALAEMMSVQADRLAAAIKARDQDTLLELALQVQQTWDVFLETVGLEKGPLSRMGQPLTQRAPRAESSVSNDEALVQEE